MTSTMPDTVENAAATPDVELPYRDLGLKDDEYREIVNLLGRRPTAAELAMYSVMWSEHCSYKSSKIHLKQLGTRPPVRCVSTCSWVWARTPAWWTSATAGRSPSRWSPTTTPPSWSPTRAPPPASGASCGTSWPWAPAPSR